MTPSHAQKLLDNIRTKPDSAVRLRVVGSIDNPEADGPGARLQFERRKAGLSVVQIADALKLRPDQIAAIESMQFTRLPGLGFSLGYVRAYAELLDISDVKGLVEDFKEVWAPHQTRHEASRKAFNPKAAVPLGFAFAAIALCAIILTAIFNNFASRTNDEITQPDSAIKNWAQSEVSQIAKPVVTLEPTTSIHASRNAQITIYGEDGALVMNRGILANESISTDGLGRWFISTNDAGALSVRGFGFNIGLGDNYQKLERFRSPDLVAMNAQKVAAEKKIADELATKALAKSQNLN